MVAAAATTTTTTTTTNNNNNYRFWDSPTKNPSDARSTFRMVAMFLTADLQTVCNVRYLHDQSPDQISHV
jgi:hypothetical protein